MARGLHVTRARAEPSHRPRHARHAARRTLCRAALLIKVDVEGAELDLLEGAQETLRRTPRPVWLVEACLTEHHRDGMNPRFAQVFETFQRAGYQAHTVGPERRQVTAADVARWVAARRRDFGSHNYEFSVPESERHSSS